MDVEQSQRKMLAAARLKDAPDPEVFDRMRRNLMARIEVEDEEPAWHEPTADDEEKSASRVWLWWSLGAVAAAALLVVLLAPSLSRQLAGDARDAAMFGHEEDSTQGQARNREPDARRGVGKRQGGPSARAPEAAAPPEVAPHTPAEDSLAIAADDGASPELVDDSSSSSPPESAQRREGSSRPPAARAAPSSGGAAASVPVSDVAGEAALLRRVQRALSRNDLAGAEASLKQYRARFPKGVLAPEADGASVIVACRRGAPNAYDRARHYLSRHSTSPLAARIRAACATESAD